MAWFVYLTGIRSRQPVGLPVWILIGGVMRAHIIFCLDGLAAEAKLGWTFQPPPQVSYRCRTAYAGRSRHLSGTLAASAAIDRRSS